MLQVEHVRVQFGRLVAVDDVSLTLEPGNLLGLIGPNGAGKTTLLRALVGQQPLTCGRVRIAGHAVVPGAIEALRHVGFTADNPPLYEQLTVREYLQFIAKGYQIQYELVNERIDFWLEQVWLTEKRDQRIKSLSRGMRQRIGIARTLLPNPRVILLDEPAAGLDPAGRVQFRQLLSSLRDQGKTLIVSSHILSDMAEYCTHIAIMAHGKTVQFGTVSEVVHGGDHTTCRYTMLLARLCPELAEILAGTAGVGEIEVNGERATFDYSRNRDEASRLLAHLIRENVPVAGFTPAAADLEQAYLRTGIRQVD
jgi:ABC-2 type transport system ATP-binding protein